MNLREALHDHLTPAQHAVLTTSFDVVGDIAITEIHEDLIEKQQLIGETLLQLNKHINVVLKKASEHEGELRIQTYEHVAGEQRTETVVKENGIELFLDVNSTYYSVRSQNERLRIMNLVKQGERILVMFSGIGPFTITLAKKTDASEVIGVELNADANAYAQMNLQRNKVHNAKELCGDVREVVPSLGEFDRIIMPLPHTAHEFLDVARSAAAPGAMIHLYCFDTEQDIEKTAQSYLVGEERIANIEKAGTYNPAVYRWCIDIQT